MSANRHCQGTLAGEKVFEMLPPDEVRTGVWVRGALAPSALVRARSALQGSRHIGACDRMRAAGGRQAFWFPYVINPWRHPWNVTVPRILLPLQLHRLLESYPQCCQEREKCAGS